jgi:Protein of unknown function (DUF3093)
LTQQEQPEQPEVELYREVGSSWWPVLWGPGFAAAGALIELASGTLHGMAWLLTGLGLAVLATAWVSARRRVLSVRLTRQTLYQGRETLPVRRIAEVDDVGASMGAKVLGGAWVVPKRFTGVPLRLSDGSRVLAWAKDADALRAAIGRLLSADR